MQPICKAKLSLSKYPGSMFEGLMYVILNFKLHANTQEGNWKWFGAEFKANKS